MLPSHPRGPLSFNRFKTKCLRECVSSPRRLLSPDTSHTSHLTHHISHMPQSSATGISVARPSSRTGASPKQRLFVWSHAVLLQVGFLAVRAEHHMTTASIFLWAWSPRWCRNRWSTTFPADWLFARALHTSVFCANRLEH